MNEHGVLVWAPKSTGKDHRHHCATMARRFTVIFAVVCLFMGHPPLSTLADEKEAATIKRVLVLNSYHPNYEWSRSVMRGIESVFANTDIDVLCSYEYMDTKHHRTHIIFELLKELYSKKYAGFKFDVIIAADNNALDFLLAYRDTLFPGSPVVFCGITGFKESMIMGHRGFTGILENYDIKGTIEMALAIHIPQSKLPKNAVIRNEPQTLYYRYKYLIWAFVALAFYQSFTIFTLRRNLGKRKRAEEDLAESRAQLQSILTSMQDIVFVFDRQGVFTECYAPKDELILPIDFFIGKKHSEVMPPDIDSKYAEGFDKCKEGKVAEYD